MSLVTQRSSDAPTLAEAPALAVAGLSVVYHAGDQRIRALDDVDLTVERGTRMAIVGESGSGKSTLGLAAMGLLPANSRFEFRRMEIDGTPVDLHDERALRAVRGRRVAMVFQDAKASLDPVRTIGSQVAEPLRIHRIAPRKQVPAAVESLLSDVEIRRPAHVARQYPHELSGGMRQRAMIAAALAAEPTVLIADEPTSALDVTTQSAVVDLIRRVGEARHMATLLITHDLALVAGFADHVVVMYAGQIVEQGAVDAVYAAPAHPYTSALLASIPSLFDDRADELGSIPGSLPDLARPAQGCRFEPRCSVGHGRERCCTEAPMLTTLGGPHRVRCHYPGELAGGEDVAVSVTSRPTRLDDRLPEEELAVPVAELVGIRKVFVGRGVGRSKHRVVAVDDIDLVVHRGESLGIVGESGSGKTTLARIFVGLERADSGTIRIGAGGDLEAVKALPKDYVQFVFQDPGDSLDPLMSVGQIIAEPLVLRDGGSFKQHRARAESLLEDVGLRADMVGRRPMELSGGQRQRVAIARALSTQPQVIIADEAVASLDMSARGQILNLFSRLQREHGFAYVYISHDLSMVRHVCDRVVVMYGGQIVETASTSELFVAPRHPYTQALISAVPIPDPELERRRPRQRIDGEAGLGVAPTGCGFRLRCPIATELCAHERPRLDPAESHTAACHHVARAAQMYASPMGER